METWRLLMEGKGSAAWNMAVDEALLRVVKEPVLRIYRWTLNAVSIGYFQSWTEASDGRPFVRRYTGGGLVDHQNDVTYTVVIPKVHHICKMPTAESYALLHRGIVRGLSLVGVNAELAACCAESDSSACFQKAVKHDVVWKGEKLAGAAQRRSREGMLHQGSVNFSEKSQRDWFRDRLPSAFEAAIPCFFEKSELTQAERAMALELERKRYDTDRWNRQK